MNLDLTEFNLGNCCFGSYFDESGVETSYTGDFNSCIGGPARHSWELTGEIVIGSNIVLNDVPATAVLQVPEDGLRESIEISGILDVTQDRSTLPIANYLELFDVSSSKLDNIRISQLPIMFRSQELRPETTVSIGDSNIRIPSIPSPSPSPLWSFSCLDETGESIHRIYFMVREWNTYEEFIKYYESAGEDADADADVKGIEGKDCAYENRSFLGRKSYCNDFWDLDDFEDPDQAGDNFEDGLNLIRSLRYNYPAIRYDEAN